MGIGTGVLLIVLGLVLVTDAVSLPQSVQDVVATDTVGWICLGAGVLAIVLALATSARSRRTHVEETRYEV